VTNNDTYALVNKQTGELAFKMYKFDSIEHLKEVQRLSYFSLIWIKEGKDHLFSFSPYQPFLFEADENTEGLVIHFHSDFFCILKHHEEVACNGVLFNNVYENPFVVIDESTKSTMNFIIAEMIKDMEVNQLAMNESIISYLKLLLINGARLKNLNHQEDSTGLNEEDKFVPQKLKDLIEQHYREKHLPKDYAELLHIISERIIIEAKRELYLTSKTVKEISTELGYEDEFYFSRFFKKNTDISPSVFRKTVGFAKAEV